MASSEGLVAEKLYHFGALEKKVCCVSTQHSFYVKPHHRRKTLNVSLPSLTWPRLSITVWVEGVFFQLHHYFVSFLSQFLVLCSGAWTPF